MDTMVGSRALTDAGGGEGARTTRSGECDAAAVAAGAWQGANGPGSTVHRALAEGQGGLRPNGFGPSLEVIERIDHGPVSNAELLELLLSFSKSGGGAGRIARNLIDHFGSLGAILVAAPNRLISFLGGDQASVFLIKIVRVAVKMTLREPLEDRSVIGSASTLMDYLSATMRHEPTEANRVLFLNRKNALIKDEVLHRGTIDHTPLYRVRYSMTKELIAALGTIGGVLHDHVIVGCTREISFRKSGLF